MLHHLPLGVTDLARASAFYDAALAPLGYVRVWADSTAAALAHGGRDNGPPGLRPDYGPHYFAAFVIDPDGHHIEAVINLAA